jgi:hypothetical protein
MSWFSRTPDESSFKAASLRNRADRELARGNVARAAQLGVQARRHERDAERDAERDVPWWRR